jgi:CheY-like chemotaxis protein
MFLAETQILIVDDSKVSSETMARILRRHGFINFSVAANGKQALELIRDKHSFGLIFSDLRMPEMGGDEFIRELRARDNKTPVVLATADRHQETLINIIEMGKVTVVFKPIQEDDLMKKINNLWKSMQEGSKV